MPRYDEVFVPGAIPPSPVDLPPAHRFDLDHLATLFELSLGLSAWKSYGANKWALRCNPSSGNLHPTEGYLLCGPVEGLCEEPMVCHYAPREHALEVRAELDPSLWGQMARGLPPSAVLVGLTSIHWREAWKYGERAFRYCQHDVGHALGALAIAAAGLGWESALVGGPSSDNLADLFGVRDPRGAEAEVPEGLMAIYPAIPGRNARPTLDPAVPEAFRALAWHGTPNALSPSHVHWPLLAEVAGATRKPFTDSLGEDEGRRARPPDFPARPLALEPIIRQRRSAVAMDGVASLGRDAFYRLLGRTLDAGVPFSALTWRARVDLLLFVHRVTGLSPGLYLLLREAGADGALRAAVRSDFAWEVPEGCPEGLTLYRLAEGDACDLAMQVSCLQDIAGDGCFAAAMIAAFEAPLETYGAWFYPRLFWEAGMMGQVLYLEAEAAGLRATGIGCYFDDPVHRVLGLEGLTYQDLYHFTVGGPVEDTRLTTLPAYPDLP
jgi:SagB-type dehydrogenase family enzyme